jgi:hypothetical protein
MLILEKKVARTELIMPKPVIKSSWRYSRIWSCIVKVGVSSKSRIELYAQLDAMLHFSKMRALGDADPYRFLQIDQRDPLEYVPPLLHSP